LGRLDAATPYRYRMGKPTATKTAPRSSKLTQWRTANMEYEQLRTVRWQMRSLIYWLPLAFSLAAWSFWPTAGQAILLGKPAPEITGGPWINSRPLTLSDLRGRVVLVEFWTYG